MSALTSRRAHTALAVFQAGDAVACAIPARYITQTLDTLGAPPAIRRVLPVVKVAAALGLLSVFRFPRLARFTTAMLTLYYALAMAAHLRVRNKVVNTIPAAALLLIFAAMTARGPDAG